MFVDNNSNPLGFRRGDCVVRALAKILRQSWDRTFIELCLQGFLMADMPNSNDVWQEYLWAKGYRRHKIYNEDPEAYTVEDFCRENPRGRYVLGIKGHVVAVIDGQYIDAWDSGDTEPIYYWKKREVKR